MKAWNFAATPPVHLHDGVLIKLRESFAFTPWKIELIIQILH
jgi:hypothetical protein